MRNRLARVVPAHAGVIRLPDGRYDLLRRRPAHAGMIRPSRPSPRTCPRAPRTRGGDPILGKVTPVPAAVLPAHAGVIRAPGACRSAPRVVPARVGIRERIGW